ncbi:hypothetical protein M427DRAFT_102937, partial [Gonapodya prolifera JEL478]
LILDVAQGMQYLHGLNIIHRDLKGSNVLIDAQGAAMAADFGFAKFAKYCPVAKPGCEYWHKAVERSRALRKGGTSTKSTVVYAFTMTC